MHDTQIHVPTKPIDEGINTDGDIVDALWRRADRMMNNKDVFCL